MKKKQFKAESKKLLDMMINSIYTHKEIFLRELISNASDAVDKLYFRSLTDDSVNLNKDDFCIRLIPDKENRILTVSDNGIGMTAEELENNLGVIAKSGSQSFKTENAGVESGDVEIIGQFGVGFYSAFMVSKKVKVISKAFGSDEANCWEADGVDGYVVYPCEKESAGTDIILYISDNTDEVSYDEFLDTYRLSALVKKYSNYIRYPIKMNVETSKPIEDKEGEYETVLEDRTLNSMVPLWKKNKSEISDEEYSAFYKEVYYDYDDPLRVIHSKTEGNATYNALMFIPSHAPFDYYSKEYEKGLQLYSKGVLITEKCADLLPDYYNFVRGLVDSEDLSLNISREVLQHDHQLKLIAKTIEKKIKSELSKMLSTDREKYEKFFDAFGNSLKFGVYNDYGMHKDELQDLLMFKSSNEKKYVTLAEYKERMKSDQNSIYYASGESIEKIEMLPQTEAAKDKGYEILYLTDYVDEFAVKTLMQYEDKNFVNICSAEADFDTAEEKEKLKENNASFEDMFSFMKDALGDKVQSVRFTHKLKNHPVCLSNEGMLSADMERVLNSMPGAGGVKAEFALEINENHPIAEKIKELYDNDKDRLGKYAKLLYGEARLIGGMTIEDPAEFAALICEMM
ncbi:MAG: molecular chaperone HtpG [Oscillospiraceae bacterium]|nr:molecular chaperone HtpG [Oscillospiraceae bacterium]